MTKILQPLWMLLAWATEPEMVRMIEFLKAETGITSRPHMTLGGRTPHEVYHRLPPANCAPRYEPRPLWPRRSPCAGPRTPIKGRPGARLQIDVAFRAGRRHLPGVTVRRAA